MPTQPEVHRRKTLGGNFKRKPPSRNLLPEDKTPYDRTWVKLRRMVLAEEPVCRSCQKSNRITPSKEVHHIIPIAENPDLRLERSNLMALCKPCHSKLTNDELHAFQRVPKWLKPSAIPLTIVCGPPGGGKTRWVRERRIPGKDIVIDLDEIKSRLSGQPWYDSGDEFLVEAVRERNRILGNLYRAPKGRGAWFIVSSPSRSDRLEWRRLLGPERVIVLETPPEVCAQRLAGDSRRPRRVDEFIALAMAWWGKYVRDPGDEVVA